jgi:uncharacterized iron-regulated protein
LVRFAGEAGLPLVALDLSRKEISTLKQRGLDALPAGFIERFSLSVPLPGDRHETLARDLFKAHCGMMFSRDLERLTLTQRARDATMAQRLIGADAGGGALMLAGYGHTRNDPGVPFLLGDLQREGALISVLLAPVKTNLIHPGDYVSWLGGRLLPFDDAWFTPRVDDDPCEPLKKIYGSRKKQSAGNAED